jgi:hypothetical protein
MSEPATASVDASYKETYAGALPQPTRLWLAGLLLVIGLGVTMLVPFAIIGTAQALPGALAKWWSNLGQYSLGQHLGMTFVLARHIAVVPIVVFIGPGSLWKFYDIMKTDAPLRRVRRSKLVMIRALTQEGISYADEASSGGIVPWSDVQAIRYMDTPAYRGRHFAVVELKKPADRRSRLVFWEGQEYQIYIKMRMQERFAAYQAQHPQAA